MSQATNFTIKDGTATDTLFTCVQPSGGNLPATYFARAKGAMPVQQPVIAISSSGRSNTTRVVKQTIKTPIVVTLGDGSTKVVDFVFTDISTTIPGSASDAVRADHTAFIRNSVDVQQIYESHTDGYAPN